jgi:cell division topological specificity factor
MSFLSFLLGEKKKASASVAKDRLQIILAHERSSLSGAKRVDLSALKLDLLTAISKHFPIRSEDIKVNLEKQDDLEVLEVKIELPDAAPAR